MSASLLAFFVALFASLVLAVPVRALALRVGMVDLPGPRKVHLQPIPLLGGLAIYGGVLLGVYSLFQGEARAQIGGILAGATLIAAVGILDDRGWLHHQVKLFIGMPLAAGILLLSGIHAQVFSVLVGGRIGEVLDALLSVGESMSCALAAMAVHELGERAVSLSGAQAGLITDSAYGNARVVMMVATGQRLFAGSSQGQ